MGACLSKKKGSSSHPLNETKSLSTPPIHQKNSENNNNVTVTLFKPEITLKKKPNNLQENQNQEPQNQDETQTQPKKEIFIIKHRKSHDEREKNIIKITPLTVQHNVPTQNIDGLVSSAATSETESMNNTNNKKGIIGISPSTPNINVVGVRTSSCTKEEVDAILIQCGRLSRSSSGKAASSSANGRKYSGSKRSFDFDHCDNDGISVEDEQKRINASETSEDYDENRGHNHRPRTRNSPKKGSSSSGSRRRTPSREREQRSSSRERRVSRSPGRRSSDTNAANGNNNGAGSGSVSGSRPGKMVTVPATVTSLVMDKSNNGVVGGEFGGSNGVKRVNVKRNVASPRSMSPARGNGNGLNQQQQQPSLSRNNSARKTEVSPYRRNPLSEVDPNSLAYPQSNANNGSSKVQNKSKKEVEVEAVQKPNVETRDNIRNRTSNRGTMEKGVNYQTKEQQEEEIKVMSDNAIVKNVVMPSGTLTRSRSSRRSRDLDNINTEPLMNPPQTSYTSLLLEDIQNFHQKNTTQSCLNKACSIIEAVADLNSTTSSNNFSCAEDKKLRNNDYNVQESFVESEVGVSDDVMEPSFHKYVTVKRGGSICGLDMDDQESSGSNSFTVSSGQQHYGICSSSWEQNSGDSLDCFSSEAYKKTLNSKRRECDHQHSGGIGRGRIGAAAAST